MKPVPTFTLDTYRFSYLQEEVEVLAERIHEDSRDGLRLDLTIATSRHPMPGTLFSGRVSLSLASQQQAVIKALLARCQNGFLTDIDWAGMLLQVEVLSKRRFRDGDPAIQLSSYSPDLSQKWLLYPYLQQRSTTVLFGDGGVGKTTLAEYIGLCAATGRGALNNAISEPTNVMYLDWETEADTHWELLNALCAGLDMKIPPNMFYRRMNASLPSSIGAVRHEVALHEIGLVIVDSIGLAGGDDPERAGPKIAIFNALRTLESCATLAIDHVSKVDHRKPYGSVYTRNIARLAWELSKAQEQEDPNVINVALRLEKINRGKAPPRHGYRLGFVNEGDSLRELMVEEMNPIDVPEFRTKMPIQYQIARILKNEGALSLSDITKELASESDKPLKEDSVRKALKRNGRLFNRTEDGLWTLFTG